MNDTQEKIDNVSPIIEPRQIPNTNLDKLFEDIEVEKEPLMTKLNDILTNDAEIEEIDENTIKESMRISNDYDLSKLTQTHQTAKKLDTNIQPVLENDKNVTQLKTNALTNRNDDEKAEEYIVEEQNVLGKEVNNNEHLNTNVEKEKENVLENKQEEFFDSIDSIPTVQPATTKENNSMKSSYGNFDGYFKGFTD